ncbi:MAG: ClbS/DfsB family four-helix bundle protein, partial [Anaerolineaceae bacterium]|nr:ClbS/DfsB family four-helix bundle protein [Anaerolineaceae bacterium]
MDRVELINKIRAGRDLIEAAFLRFSTEQMLEPALPDGWSPKDVMVHLGWWEMRAADIYGSLSRGSIPRMVISEDEIDRVNQRVINEYRAQPLEEVIAFERQAYRHLLTIAETAPEADLFNPHRFPWTSAQPFVNWIIWNTYDHYEEHLVLLERRLEELDSANPSVAVTGGVNPIVQRGGEFLHAHGRDIDQALFDCTFGKCSTADAMAVLARYQNPDGGFAGLEVDIKAPQSNPFATELALVAMRWLSIPRDHPLLLRTLGFLETTQLDDGTWRFTPEIYQHELAPWFQGWKWPNLNPSCTISGVLKQLGVGSERLHNRVRSLFERLARPDDLLSSEYYNLRPYAWYFLTSWEFPQSEFYRYGVVWWMVRAHLTNPDLD